MRRKLTVEERNANNRASLKKYREAHKEEIRVKRKARDKTYRDAHKEEAKAYRASRKEETRIYNKTYDESHKEEIKARREANKDERKTYRDAHKEEMKPYFKEYGKLWRKANPEKQWAKKARRRARKAGVVNLPIRLDILDYLIEIWGNKCAYCKKYSDKWNLDHFMPLNLKGHDAEYNLVLSCPPCNFSKRAKHPFIFIKDRRICFTFKSYMKFPY